mmetsp:Transcript_9232/g.33852  ORF Transcript_9232/g.33852 Transcript_9232/m.33852 type:complete len:83 (+) Transcript_9232:1477-1725(+)
MVLDEAAGRAREQGQGWAKVQELELDWAPLEDWARGQEKASGWVQVFQWASERASERASEWALVSRTVLEMARVMAQALVRV